MLEANITKAAFEGNKSNNEVLFDEVSDLMTGKGGAGSVEPIAFNWRTALTPADIDENATRAMYASMTDEDLIAAVDAMGKHLAGMVAYTGSVEENLGKVKPMVA